MMYQMLFAFGNGGGADSASRALTLWSAFCELGKTDINILNSSSQGSKEWTENTEQGS